MTLPRRLLLATLAAPALHGCGAPFPPLPDATGPQAQALLDRSAAAHGLVALGALADVSVSYAGTWRPIVGRLQPVLVDAGFRATSEERMLLRQGVTAQGHTGPQGRKHVVRDRAGVRAWFNGAESQQKDQLDAAALVADAYALFLLGPMLLARRGAVPQLGAPQRVIVDGRDHECDVLRFRLVPGLGLSGLDQLDVAIDRAEHLMRRVRFTLDGLQGTRGAVAEVDAWRHIEQGGVRWPTRFYERLLRPVPLPVHDWSLTGLDLDRGLTRAELEGPELRGRATAPAAVLG